MTANQLIFARDAQEPALKRQSARAFRPPSPQRFFGRFGAYQRALPGINYGTYEMTGETPASRIPCCGRVGALFALIGKAVHRDNHIHFLMTIKHFQNILWDAGKRQIIISMRVFKRFCICGRKIMCINLALCNICHFISPAPDTPRCVSQRLADKLNTTAMRGNIQALFSHFINYFTLFRNNNMLQFITSSGYKSSLEAVNDR